MTITRSDAEVQAQALRLAAADSPVLPLRQQLRAQAEEWARASELLGDVGDAGTIVLLGTVVPGMAVANPSEWSDFLSVTRSMGARDGQASIQLEGAEGRPVYRNFLSLISPVVVQA
jgi:hypothetical protein